MRTGLVLAAALVAATPLARAQEPPAPSLAHKGQFGVHLQPGVGYRVLFPYDKEFCGTADEDVCTGRAPAFLELGVSYGVARALDLVVELRLGLETDFSAAGVEGPRQLALTPGVRLFIDEEGSLKFFSTLGVTLDFTDFTKVSPLLADGVDVGVREVNGLLFDVNRHVGVYVHFGETLGFRRWLRFEVDAGLGVQGRFP